MIHVQNWQQTIAGAIHQVEERFDALKQRLASRRGTPVIVPYLGYGRAQQVVLRGRVLRNPAHTTAVDNKNRLDDLRDMLFRFATNEVPFARVRARCGQTAQTVTADEEGHFTIALSLPHPLPVAAASWQEVALELVYPETKAPVRATGRAFVPAPVARFGVISDLDDTMMLSHATNLLRMARTVFMGSAKTRQPFPGVAAFYRALHAAENPLVYLSSSPWNLYDLLLEFFTMQDIPLAPLFLRDWGITQTELLPTQHGAHKLGAIRELLAFYAGLPFILIGDSGQQDPEIYAQVVHEYPGRITAVYIRNVTTDPNRDQAVQQLAAQVQQANSTLILAADTLTMAQHAAAQGWISQNALAEISREMDD